MLRIFAGLVLLGFLTVSSAEIVSAAPNKCTRLLRQSNIETLVNTCDACQIVSIIRSRPGNSVPVGRKFHVQPGHPFLVPFRGPGRSRITAERPCPGEKGAQKDLLKAFDAPQSGPQCVSMEQGGSGIELVNRCGECKAVAIERVSANGRDRVRDYMALSGNAKLPVSPRGFASVGLLAEIPCPS